MRLWECLAPVPELSGNDESIFGKGAKRIVKRKDKLGHHRGAQPQADLIYNARDG